MSYTPEATSVDRELGKIAAELRAHADAITAHAVSLANMSQRIEALEARAWMTPAKWDFESDFTRNWTDSGFMEQAKEPGKRASLVTVDGKACVRLLTLPGDIGVNGSGDRLRNDLTTSQQTTDGYAGRAHHWEHSVWFPDDYVQPPESQAGGIWHSGLVFDFHNTGGSVQANFQVAVYPATAIDPGRPTGLCLELNHGDPMRPTMVRVPVQKGAITKNKWYQFEYHVRWAADNTGLFRAWVNGVPYMDHKGPTLYTGQGVYVKLANYGTVSSSVIHTGVKRRAIP